MVCLKHNYVRVPAGKGKSYLLCRNIGCGKRKGDPASKPKPNPKK